MDALALCLARHAEGAGITQHHRWGRGSLDERRKIIAQGVRNFVLETDGIAVSSFDIGRALAQFPEELRRGWLNYPHIASEVSVYALDSNNAHISGGRVRVMTIGEAITQVNNERHPNARLSFSCSEDGHQREVYAGVDLFHRNLPQLRAYVRKRFQRPEITAKYALDVMPEVEESTCEVT